MMMMMTNEEEEEESVVIVNVEIIQRMSEEIQFLTAVEVFSPFHLETRKARISNGLFLVRDHENLYGFENSWGMGFSDGICILEIEKK